MKAKEYFLIDRCIEDGIIMGWNRAHKHTDTPSEDQIKQAIHLAVTNEICEWFTFNDEINNEV
jgi:hypothetical protein